MRKVYLYLLSVLILTGCFVKISAPDNDARFSEKTKLNDYVGCYENLGEYGDRDTKTLLSTVIWPNDEKIDHEKIKHINVKLASENTLNVEAKSEKEVVYSSNFVKDKDFTMSEGLIKISGELTGSLAGEAGNPFIGVAGGSTALGLDQNGNGKMSTTTAVAGTAFIFIPIGAYVDVSVRFKKLKNGCN